VDQGGGFVDFQADGRSVKATAQTFGWESTPVCAVSTTLGEEIGEGTFPKSMIGAKTITVVLARHHSDEFQDIVGRGTLTLRRVT